VLYLSTRGGAPERRFTEILLEGLAADGGLYVPAAFPRLSLPDLRQKSYQELAHAILSQFMDDVPGLEGIVARTYTETNFQSKDITPLRKLEPDLYLLGLSNGPSLAFKDVALQLLGNLFEEVLEK
jgi:threonine synthase